VERSIHLTRVGTGDAGSLTVSIASDAPDPNSSNNSAPLPVMVAGHGVDLVFVHRSVVVQFVFPPGAQPGGNLDWLSGNAGVSTGSRADDGRTRR
jgi:hypothetical protein